MPPAQVIDLRTQSSAHLTGALLSCLRTLAPGGSVLFQLCEDPEWALRSVDLHLQHRLDWHCERVADGSWRATVRCADGAAADDLIALLLRDHRRLDALLARALSLLNLGEAEAARAAFASCANALRAHLALEDEVLVPRLHAHATASEDAAGAMHAEHAEIVTHLGAVAQALADGAGDVSEAAILCGMLSGLMAKHEHREEMTLFPFWQAALARLDARACDRLLNEARARLGPHG